MNENIRAASAKVGKAAEELVSLKLQKNVENLIKQRAVCRGKKWGITGVVWASILPILPIGGFVFAPTISTRIVDGLKIGVLIAIISVIASIAIHTIKIQVSNVTDTVRKTSNIVNDAIRGRRFNFLNILNPIVTNTGSLSANVIGHVTALIVLIMAFIALWIAGICVSVRGLTCPNMV